VGGVVHDIKTLYFVALIHQNEEILDLLDSFATGLTAEDMEPLKIYIFHCIDIHAAAQFSFIMQRCPSILSHINQDFLPFQKILETYCQSHAKHFLNLIPKEKTMRYSLFQLVSLSSSSESEDEKIVNFKKPVKISTLKK
jgi:hypothetical protein